jgi:hypothetical protein
MSEKKQKGHDYSTVIIWSSALVGMIRYSAAFLASDLGVITGTLSELVTFMLGISGFFTGILGTFGTAYLYDGWRRKIPAAGTSWQNKFKVLTGFVMAAFLAEILILVPFTMSRVMHVSVADVLKGGVWWWSTAVVVMPIILIGGVSLGNQVVTVNAESSGNFPESFRNAPLEGQKDAGKFPKDWRKVRKMLTDQQVSGIADSHSKIICDLYGIDERTARNWRKYAREEKISAATTSVEAVETVKNQAEKE